MVTEDQIQAILENSDHPQQAADRLVKAANRAGGIDNISVVVLDAIGEGGEPADGRRVAPPSRRTLARWGLRAGLAILIVVALLVGARVWLDRQWYVGPEGDQVAVFQGIPLTILGFELSHPVIVRNLPADEVRKLEQYDKFDEGITAADREEAFGFVEQIEEDLRAARQAEREARLDAGTGGSGQ
jgi:protein phosphatase